MTNFECCKTKPFPSSYFICISCHKVYHKSCVLREKSKYTFVGGYKIKCCASQAASGNLENSQDKSILEETLSEMLENSQLKDQHICKLKQDHKKFLDECEQREEELNTLIRNQKTTLQKAKEEIENLKNDILLLTTKSLSTKGTQTSCKNYISTKTQTETTCDMGKDVGSLSNKNNLVNNSCRKRVILVSGSNGKQLVHSLSRYLDDFYVSSIIKPNAPNHELMQTAISSSKDLTKKDAVVIWPKENSCHLLNNLIDNLKHTNCYILTTPNRYDYPNWNENIYYSNLALHRTVLSATGNLNCLININSCLNRSNYGRSGYYILQNGKRYIAKYIANRIKKDSHMTKINEANLKKTGPIDVMVKNMNHIYEDSNVNGLITASPALDQDHFLSRQLRQTAFKTNPVP